MTSLWEIGVSEITGPGVRWTGEFVKAPDEARASEIATDAGYYRNLRLRPAPVQHIEPGSIARQLDDYPFEWGNAALYLALVLIAAAVVLAPILAAVP